MKEYTNSRILELIGDYIHNDRDRSILAKRLIDGVIIEKLAEDFELSPRQIRNILQKNENILFKHLP